MRVLLDECVDERLRHSFAEHDCETARFAGLAGLKNGALLVAAERAGFDVIVTVDQNIPDQAKPLRSFDLDSDPLRFAQPSRRPEAARCSST